MAQRQSKSRSELLGSSVDPRRYLSEKEAAARYPYSRFWFQRKRWEGGGPPYIKVANRVMYPVPETDNWFDAHGLRISTSESRLSEPEIDD